MNNIAQNTELIQFLTGGAIGFLVGFAGRISATILQIVSAGVAAILIFMLIQGGGQAVQPLFQQALDFLMKEKSITAGILIGCAIGVTILKTRKAD